MQPKLTLYVEKGCFLCAKVLITGAVLDLDFKKRDIGDPAISAELAARGGKVLVPYLVDENAKVEMYESDAIVNYLESTYGTLSGA
jgi:glutathione S-transferase